MSARPNPRKRKRPPKNTVVIHRCKACGSRWDNKVPQKRCPVCEYAAPRVIDDKNFHVIETVRVNTDDKGRIKCHLVKK